MNEALQNSGLDLGLLLLGGLALVAVLAVARYLVELAPMARSRREALRRTSPVVGGIAGFLYVVFAARALFLRHYPEFVPLILTVIVIGFVAISWFALRDVVAGLVLRAGRVCTVGDFVHIDGVQGRIAQMGFRVLTLETRDGDEAIIPYGKVAATSLLRTPVLESVALHLFSVEVPEGASLIDTRDRVRRAAMESHWSSLVREPKVVQSSARTLEVTVFCLDVDHGPHVEKAVREALESPTPAAPRWPGGPSPVGPKLGLG